MTVNAAITLVEAAKRFPEKVALHIDKDSFSYEVLGGSARWVSSALRQRGVRTGDRVALVLPNSLGYVAAFYGVLAAGATAVPINPLLKLGEIGRILQHAETSVIVTHEGEGDAVAAADQAGVDVFDLGPQLNSPFGDDQLAGLESLEIPVTSPIDDALILYTSGTTGNPKGVRLSHSSITWITEILAARALAVTSSDIFLASLPLSHIFGLLAVMNVAMSAAASLVIQSRFDAAEALDLIDKHQITVVEGVPAMLSALLEEQGQRSTPPAESLRLAFVGGQSTPVEVLRRVKSTYSCALVESYGTTETGSAITTTPLDADNEEFVGKVGTPLWGVDLQIRDDAGNQVRDGSVGEVIVRSLGMMNGYHKNADATEAALRDGWFATGDLGFVQDGVLTIVDRKKEMIIRGGYNVYPREIEEVIYEFPDVREAAVIGVPDSRLGEEVVAVVALRQLPTSERVGEEIREFVRQRVASYKYPRFVYIVDELPKNATGKISKRNIDVDALVSSR